MPPPCRYWKVRKAWAQIRMPQERKVPQMPAGILLPLAPSKEVPPQTQKLPRESPRVQQLPRELP